MVDMDDDRRLLAAAARLRRVEAKPQGEAEREGGCDAGAMGLTSLPIAIRDEGDGGGPDRLWLLSASREPLRLMDLPLTSIPSPPRASAEPLVDAFDLVKLRGCTLLIVLRLLDTFLPATPSSASIEAAANAGGQSTLTLVEPPRSSGLEGRVRAWASIDLLKRCDTPLDELGDDAAAESAETPCASVESYGANVSTSRSFALPLGPCACRSPAMISLAAVLHATKVASS